LATHKGDGQALRQHYRELIINNFSRWSGFAIPTLIIQSYYVLFWLDPKKYQKKSRRNDASARSAIAPARRFAMPTRAYKQGLF
jgi:hypothetical protein